MPSLNTSSSLLLALLLSIHGGAVCVASAQDAPDGPAQARALFDAGTDALRRESFEEAVELLNQSHDLLPNIANAFNLAVALLRVDHPVQALALLRELEEGALGELGDEQRRAVSERITEAEGQVAILEISVSGASSPTIHVDGVVLPGVSVEGQVSTEVDPGPHRVEVRAPGREPETRMLEARAGVRTNVAFALLSSSATALPAPAEAPPSNDTEAWAWALGTTGVVLIAGGIVLGVVLGTSGRSPITDPVTGIGETLVVSGRY